MFDQWDAASRGNDSIEREQIIEMQKLDAVLEDLGFAPEGRMELRFEVLDEDRRRIVGVGLPEGF